VNAGTMRGDASVRLLRVPVATDPTKFAKAFTMIACNDYESVIQFATLFKRFRQSPQLRVHLVNGSIVEPLQRLPLPPRPLSAIEFPHLIVHLVL
jgi:hypothetical protein